jgi:hypothetical protein
MPPLPSKPFRRSRRARWALAGAAAFLLLGVRRADALDLTLDLPRVLADTVWVEARLSNPFSERTRESLLRGMPATLQLRAELWHRRTGWFDRLEKTVDAEIRIRYEVWNRTFRIERLGVPPQRLGTLDSLERALTRPLAVPIGRLGAETHGGIHFVVVTAVLRPLSVEDAAEVENWLSGEVNTQRRSGFGLITQVPRALFDTVRNFAGFGDARARATSGDFAVERLNPR